VLLLCTWSIQHLPVPLQCRAQSIRQHANGFFCQLRVKLRWMLVTLIAPELLCGVAAEEWLYAKQAAQTMAERAKDDGEEWTTSHGFFAQMGGFRLRFPSLESRVSPRTSSVVDQVSLPCNFGIAAAHQEPLLDPLSYPHAKTWESFPDASSPNDWVGMPVNVAIRKKSFRSVPWDISIMSRQHAKLSTSLGPTDWSPDTGNAILINRMMYENQNDAQAGEVALTAMKMTTDVWTLSLPQIQLAQAYGIIESLPNMSKADLDALSNSDKLAKALAVSQVLWLVVQIISRAVTLLSVCQLEIATASFGICTFITYGFLWQKPQDVSRPIYLEATRRATVAEAWELAQFGLEDTSSLVYRARSWRQSREHLRLRRHSNTIMLLCATALGGVHCAAWNFAFPDLVEKWAWRSCALGSTVLPVFLLVWHETYLCYAFTKHEVFSVVVLVGFMLYGCFRLFIMVEMFRCLFFLPRDAFVTTWTTNLPGIS
jgi:hypothetical protein